MYNNKLNAQKFQNIYSSAFCQNSMLTDIKNCLKNLGLPEVDNGQKETVLKEGSVIQKSVFGNFVIILHKGAYYIQLTDKDSVILFEIKQNGFTNSIYLAFFLIAFIFLAGLYLFTMKNIKSIDKFGKAIKKLADGGINSEIVSANEQDELLKKFDETVKNIADIYNARTLFLRAIMHELKTPIGKGRIVAEMVENHLNKERLIKIFRRLETLIGEFAKTEQLITQNYMLEKQKHSLQKILSLSFDFLMLEPEQLDKRVAKKFPKKSIYINADLDSMALAFKNLIDNAIKYSSNGCVAISLKKNVLLFANKGKPLDKPITDYKKPFISSDDAVRVRMKMGLGLYIAENILTLHGLTLNYKYKNGYHCFYINLITS